MLRAVVTLDDDFPLGEGTADTVVVVGCPYCGEQVTIAVDPGSGARQEYVEDCPVCCNPWAVTASFDGAGAAAVSLRTLEE